MSKDKPTNGKAQATQSDKQSVGPSATKTDVSKDDTQDKVVPYLSLYRGIDGNDSLAMFLGLLGSFVNGLTFPAFSFIFAEVRMSTLPLTLECKRNVCYIAHTICSTESANVAFISNFRCMPWRCAATNVPSL